MTRTLTKTVALVGMMGAGKSAVGNALAERLNVAFLDSDQESEAASNQSFAEIFARYGERFFREIESQVIERLLVGKPGILSTGGGAFLAKGNRKNMSELGVSLWLNAEPDVLWNRVKHKTTRPLLQTENPYTMSITFSSTCDTLLSSTYQHTVHWLPFIILFAVHLSYGFIMNPISVSVEEKSSYQRNALSIMP